ncbi:hypothetical protein PENTCL1PPCAC_868 [Pristionchus entomophagus]|uniref:Uncharacterized protein n=1 Tax=Pristionchus entomophagus TaxID=358040 RepID=A0AAV5S7R5_9BILA|nr:hypothetical protein PENTCL1PPCAC_868 [Pristionchus entomophagus]
MTAVRRDDMLQTAVAAEPEKGAAATSFDAIAFQTKLAQGARKNTSGSCCKSLESVVADLAAKCTVECAVTDASSVAVEDTGLTPVEPAEIAQYHAKKAAYDAGFAIGSDCNSTMTDCNRAAALFPANTGDYQAGFMAGIDQIREQVVLCAQGLPVAEAKLEQAAKIYGYQVPYTAGFVA